MAAKSPQVGNVEPYDVFIAHRRAQKALARELKYHLALRGKEYGKNLRRSAGACTQTSGCGPRWARTARGEAERCLVASHRVLCAALCEEHRDRGAVSPASRRAHTLAAQGSRGWQPGRARSSRKSSPARRIKSRCANARSYCGVGVGWARHGDRGLAAAIASTKGCNAREIKRLEVDACVCSG